MHTSGEFRTPVCGNNFNKSVMKEYDERDWGLVTLDNNELQMQGGITFKELRRLLEEAATIAEEIQKYWPRFRKGFLAGWEAA